MKDRITRRDFLKAAGTVTAAASAAGCGLVLSGCTKGRTYDLVIRNGLAYDGLGGPPRTLDFGIVKGRIESIGVIAASRGGAVIDAEGLAVAPGFIDIHQHTDTELLVNPGADSAVRQGVTTVISGNCGSSPVPVADSVYEERVALAREQYGIQADWRDFPSMFRRMEDAGIAVNYGTLVGHGAVRGAAMGLGDRAAKPEELERMKTLVAEAMSGGALGLSSGLEYTPGSFAPADELTELCRVVAARGGVYATHMRDEGDLLIEALNEAIGVARASGVSLQVSHLKTAYPRNWGKIEAALAAVEEAKASGMDILADRYPYPAASTDLGFNFPLWARKGTTEEFLARLKDPAQEPALREAIAEREAKIGSWDKIVISSVLTEKNKGVEGLDVLVASRQAGKKPFEFMRDLLVEERGNVGMVMFIMSEDNLERILAHPLVGVGSDSTLRSPEGPLGTGKPHPRAYGTFPRALGVYVRERKIVSLEEMIRKITSMPARKFGLAGRGVLEPGAAADIVVFDPRRIADQATWSDPHRFPAGIEHVVVNGRAVIDRGQPTGNLSGVILRGGGPGA